MGVAQDGSTSSSNSGLVGLPELVVCGVQNNQVAVIVRHITTVATLPFYCSTAREWETSDLVYRNNKLWVNYGLFSSAYKVIWGSSTSSQSGEK